MYVDAMNRYFAEGHAVEVTGDVEVGKVRYLPHHPVFREDKSSTKCRVVFDASAKTHDGVSLKDCLLEGPKTQPDLVQVLSRFRWNRIGLVSDIKAIFLQIKLRPEDQDVHRFLWRDMDGNQSPSIYRKTVLTFGAKSSPFESESTVHMHVAAQKKQFPEVAEEVQKLYVDDYVGGRDTVKDAVNLQRDMTQVMSLGGV